MKHKYSKEDLLWEAVRRNERYKKFFYDNLANREIQGQENNKFFRIDLFQIDSCWQMMYLPSPTIDSITIKKEQEELREILKATESTKGGARTSPSKKRDESFQLDIEPNNLHPYHYLFRDHQRVPVIFHNIPGSPYDGIVESNERYYALQKHEHDKKLLCIEKRPLINDPMNENIYRILVSIDPLAPDEQILKIVKKIKAHCKNIVSEQSKNTKAKYIRMGGIVEIERSQAHPLDVRKINNYINCLRVYDLVVNTYMNDIHHNELVNIDGAIYVPPEYMKKAVPESIPGGDDPPSKGRIFSQQYQLACQLIKAAPNLNFQVARPKGNPDTPAEIKEKNKQGLSNKPSSTQRRKRRSVAEKKALLQEAKQSGERLSAFARKHGISPNLFYRWNRLQQPDDIS